VRVSRAAVSLASAHAPQVASAVAVLGVLRLPLRLPQPDAAEALDTVHAAALLSLADLCAEVLEGGGGALLVLRAAAAAVLVEFVRAAPARRAALLLRSSHALEACLRVWRAELAAAPRGDAALGVLLTRLLLALAEAGEASCAALCARGTLDEVFAALGRVRAMRDPRLPPLLGLCTALLEVGGGELTGGGCCCAGKEAGGAAPEPCSCRMRTLSAVSGGAPVLAALLTDAACAAASQVDRLLRNDIAGLLYTAVMRGGPATAGALARCQALAALLRIAGAGAGASMCISSPGSGVSLTSRGEALMPITRSAEDMELLALTWRALVPCCLAAEDGGACTAELVHALLTHLRRFDGDGSPRGAATAVGTSVSSTSTRPQRSALGQTWSAGLRAALEGHALAALAALVHRAPTAPIMLGAARALADWAACQLEELLPVGQSGAAESMPPAQPLGRPPLCVEPLLVCLRTLGALVGVASETGPSPAPNISHAAAIAHTPGLLAGLVRLQREYAFVTGTQALVRAPMRVPDSLSTAALELLGSLFDAPACAASEAQVHAFLTGMQLGMGEEGDQLTDGGERVCRAPELDAVRADFCRSGGLLALLATLRAATGASGRRAVSTERAATAAAALRAVHQAVLGEPAAAAALLLDADDGVLLLLELATCPERSASERLGPVALLADIWAVEGVERALRRWRQPITGLSLRELLLEEWARCCSPEEWPEPPLVGSCETLHALLLPLLADAVEDLSEGGTWVRQAEASVRRFGSTVRARAWADVLAALTDACRQQSSAAPPLLLPVDREWLEARASEAAAATTAAAQPEVTPASETLPHPLLSRRDPPPAPPRRRLPGALFTLEERKAAARDKAEMLAKSFMGTSARGGGGALT